MSQAQHDPDLPEPEPSLRDTFAQALAQRAGASRGANGELDLLATVGGWRGLAETILPSLVFLTIFMATRQLQPSLIGAVAVAVVFAIARLIAKGSILNTIYGVVGVAVCALFSSVTNNALNYYVPGFIINVVSIVVVAASLLARWPVAGLVFGYLRGEGVAWRQRSARMRVYMLATLVILALFVARLAVQFPLYLAGNVDALGLTRLLMGVPLYALALWLAWSISRIPGKKKIAED